MQPAKLVISILDINAKLIESHSIKSNSTNTSIEIALDQRLSPGIYFVKLNNGSVQIIEKFINN
ncbi:MAG: T9SS type A sorting domain-containing protein [Bacteroidetes bacterium]|nr:T9SS type A sorting domain-containing protein [Bacteroidota bacterium]MBT3801655.1 T9SS type A sorting domain-containing protein [Bacteroidota bacterium]MBT4727994.1 T9SS type A sorting domain-containing protein [Bacteroidota bacterium]MBT7825538.1 T9SS type A sorting domain-containing protein [Bacteroidota bacterium]MBT7994644.1 T9SS type A sorting domain-containing protein [Bacteroidota bacterium]